MLLIEQGNCTGNRLGRSRVAVLVASIVLGLGVLAGMATASVASAASNGVVAWGWNESGQLGVGEFNDHYVPAEVVGLGGAKAVSAGERHSLALVEGGKVMAWGNDEYGQLGNGSTSTSALPVEVKELSSVTAIAAGWDHSLALLENGTVMAWGDNEYGQLGDNSTVSSDVPKAVQGLTGVKAIAAGSLHSLALLENGTVVAWGLNNGGQLGNGTNNRSAVPVAVEGLSGVVAIAAGEDFSEALLSSGKVMAWGDNGGGELGDGAMMGPESCGEITACSKVPIEVKELTGVTAISISGHSLALLSNDTVKAWGYNTNGQLGDGTTTNRDTPVSVSGLSGVKAVSAGYAHSLALLANGTVMAWGANFEGELGTGTAAKSETPVSVVGLSGVATISAGVEHELASGPELPVGGSPPKPTVEEKFGLENPGEPKYPRTCAGDPVNCATGDLTESQTDLHMGGRGIPLTFTRTYNAQAAVAQSTPGPFGYGWSTTFSDHLVINSETKAVTVVQANGSTVVFKGTGEPGELTAPKWAQAKLVLNSDGTYVYTLPSQETFHFDSSGRLLSESDRNGNTTTMNRNTEGRLESVTDVAGRKLTLTYNSEGLVESVKDPMGHTVKYTYESGNLASMTLPGESSPRWQFKYDSSHRLTTMTDGRGGKTTNQYDSSNRVTSQTDPMEHTTSFEYGRQTTTITNKVTGSVTIKRFTEGGELEAITHGYGTPSARTEAFTYDGAGDLKSVTDGNGHTTKYGYDKEGNKTVEIDADKHETKWTYDSTHDVLSTTTPNGETTTIKRDSHGNPEAIERPAPGGKTQITKYKYNSLGELESVTNPLEHTWTYEYDSKGDRTSETDPEGNRRTWEYNEDSQEIATVSPRGNVSGGEPAKYTTKIERDEQGRPVKTTDPLGHTTKYTYDADGNLETQTDGNNNKTKYTYNADNEPTKVEQPNGTVTETGYDGAGQVTSQTDGNKHTTKYVRNILEQVIETIDPKERKTLKEYDAAGNLTKLTDAAKRVTTYTYDPANRLTEISYSDGKTHAVKYEYNGDGLRTHMTDGSGETTYIYDQLDHMTESKDGHGDVVKYEYDLANDPVKITYPNGKTVTRAYDKDGRLESVTDWLEHTTKFAYDPDSNPSSTTFPTGTGNVDTYAYNEADQMSEVKMSKGTETLASLAYTRDNNGQLKTVTGKGLPGEEKPSYEYDANSRMTKAGTTAYEYDAANDATKIGSGTYTYDTASELEAGPSTKYTYNEVGERSKLSPTTGAATTYTYDQAGNLIAIERPKEGKVAALTDTFTYDGNGLRASQTISGTKNYLTWQMTGGVPPILNDGTNSYIYGPEGSPIEQINNTTGTVLYLHHDQQGSTRLLTGSSGKVEGKCSYSAYGSPTCEGTATTPLGYDGQYTNSDTGLIYMRARVYDPATAQFLSVDPAVAITREPYNYAGDNPLNYKDRSGLGWEEALEGPSIPNPWGEAEHASEELLRPGVEAVEHGAENVWHAINENEEQGDEGEAELRAKEAQRENACNPTPPGYDPETWTKGPASRLKEPDENYYDPEGNEWHWHAPDRWHDKGHWDRKPSEPWNAEWEEVPYE